MLGSGAGAAAGFGASGTTTGAGARGGAMGFTSGAAMVGGAISRGPLYSIGSRRKVYWRTSRPVAQLSSTSTSTNGSLIASVDVSTTMKSLSRR
ncbi:MAG: hypothetical protein M5U08_16115 [Burkholderiales bacterium]|nr:hypothetical protein [Burkholderiales bacterium]